MQFFINFLCRSSFRAVYVPEGLTILLLLRSCAHLVAGSNQQSKRNRFTPCGCHCYSELKWLRPCRAPRLSCQEGNIPETGVFSRKKLETLSLSPRWRKHRSVQDLTLLTVHKQVSKQNSCKEHIKCCPAAERYLSTGNTTGVLVLINGHLRRHTSVLPSSHSAIMGCPLLAGCCKTA